MFLLQQLKLCVYLWYLGIKESLQLQRCIVLLAVDEENLLWAKILDLIKLHGGIFLGSLAWWQYVVSPFTAWTLRVVLAPVAGAEASDSLHALLTHLSQALWMAPAYGVTLLVSCSWYNDVAQRAVHVRSAHNARLRTEAEAVAAAAGAPPPPLTHRTSSSITGGGPAAAGSSGQAGSAYETAASELYRVTLFAVLYVEILVLSFVPVVGYGLSVLLSCWLYAYYCYDYQWTLRGMKLQDRLVLFEGCAPFFAGYGLLLTSVTVVLPFYMGSALMSLLFPAFVLVACDSHVTHVILEAMGQMGPTPSSTRDKKAGGEFLAAQVRFRIPILWMASWPTQALLNALFARRRGSSGGTASDKKSR